MSHDFSINLNGHGEAVLVQDTIELRAMPPRSGKSELSVYAAGVLVTSDRLDLIADKSRERSASRIAGALQQATSSQHPDATEVSRMLLALADALRQGKSAEPAPTEAEIDAKRALEANDALAASQSLLECPAILWHVDDAVHKSGLAGERCNALLLYLVVTGRVQAHINSMVVKGPSSAGKNTLVKHVLALFPASAYFSTTGLSERALIHSSEDFRHRFIMIDEAGGLGNDSYLTLLLRCLISEGRIRYDTVERQSEEEGGGVRGVVIEKEGPTGLITTTTRAALYEDMENRLLSMTIRDDPQQSRAVLSAIAKGRAGRRVDVDLSAWVAAQRWIEIGGLHEATIPFAEQLAELVPVTAVRIRRDFSQLLDLIAASAILHQRQRKVQNDQVVATLADYSIVRGLLADVWDAVQQDGLTPSQRAAVEKVREIWECRISSGATEPLVTYRDLSEAMGLDRSTISRRVGNPLRLGYVTNEENRKGQPAKLKPGAPMPGAAIPLPPSRQLADLTGLPLHEGDPGDATAQAPDCRCGYSSLEFVL